MLNLLVFVIVFVTTLWYIDKEYNFVFISLIIVQLIPKNEISKALKKSPLFTELFKYSSCNQLYKFMSKDNSFKINEFDIFAHYSLRVISKPFFIY